MSIRLFGKNVITYRIFFFEKPVRPKDVTDYIDLTDEDEIKIIKRTK